MKGTIIEARTSLVIGDGDVPLRRRCKTLREGDPARVESVGQRLARAGEARLRYRVVSRAARLSIATSAELSRDTYNPVNWKDTIVPLVALMLLGVNTRGPP